MIDCLTGAKNALSEPIASNLPFRGKMAELLASAFLAELAESPELEARPRHCDRSQLGDSLENTELDVHRIQRETRGLFNAVAPHWVGVVKQHPFANINHSSRGKLLSPHSHAIGFGIDIRQSAEVAVAKLGHRHRTRFDGVPGVKLTWIKPTKLDITRVAYYPWKAPHRCKTLYQNDAAGKANLHESEANDRWIRYLRMIEILASCRVDRMIYAGGQGQGIRKDALRAANSWLLTGEADRHPPIHSDAVAAYFVDLMVRNG